MIVVTGSIQARPETLDELLALSVEHVRRSRAEPGCLSHAVHQDVDDPLRLVFVEEWADRKALHGHFTAPSSQDFASTAATLAAAPPVINVYDANPIGSGRHGGPA